MDQTCRDSPDKKCAWNQQDNVKTQVKIIETIESYDYYKMDYK